MDKYARISVSAKDGKIEISGSEDFVREQVMNFRDFIMKNQEVISVHPSAPPTSNPEIIESETLEEDSSTEYKNVIAFDGEEIKILKDIPGESLSDRMVNAALIYLFAKIINNKEETAYFSEIRQVCKDHACLNASNFSTVLKKQKNFFLINGSGKSMNAKLTHPGRKQAEELVKELGSK